MMARTGESVDPRWHRMPPGASHWVKGATADELWTAREAAAYAVLYLMTQTVPDDVELRPIYSPWRGRE